LKINEPDFTRERTKTVSGNPGHECSRQPKVGTSSKCSLSCCHPLKTQVPERQTLIGITLVHDFSLIRKCRLPASDPVSPWESLQQNEVLFPGEEEFILGVITTDCYLGALLSKPMKYYDVHLMEGKSKAQHI
jgi:hypothetical protein